MAASKRTGALPAAGSSGTWYLAQAADGAWHIHARMQTSMAVARTLLELSGYPAVITPGGNLFHLGSSLYRLAALREN